MAVNAYLNFNGNCREAVQFYAEVFDLEQPQLATFGENQHDSEYPMPEEAKNLIMHTYLTIGGSMVMFSDVFPGMPYVAGNNITLAFIGDDAEAMKTYFERLQDGGTVDIPLQETFWTKLYGKVTDRFGITWQFNYGSE